MEELKYCGTVTMNAADYIAMVDSIRALQRSVEFYKECYYQVVEEIKKLKEGVPNGVDGV